MESNLKKTADAWGGDINIGEQPETEALAEQTAPHPEAPRRDYSERGYPDPAIYHNWVMINGHIVMDSERAPEQLVDDHGFKNLDKDLAYGRVAVQHRWTANFQILHTNVGLSLVLKALKSYAKEQGWGDIAFVDHNGEELSMERKASLDGVGESNPDKAWSLTDKNPGTDIQPGQFYMNPAQDGPKSGLYECPHCGLELDNYSDFRTHLMDEKSALTAPNDTPDLAPIDHDKVMPADWNNSTSPDWIGIMSKVAAEAGRFQIFNADGEMVNDAAPDAGTAIFWAQDMIATTEANQAEVYEVYDSVDEKTLATFYKDTPEHNTRLAAPKVTIPGPIPFIFDIEDDRVYVGHPGDEIEDVQAGDYNPLGIVEGLYKPTGEVEITTSTNMPYTIRHMIQLWYYMHPELEVKSVTMVWEDGGRQKLAGATNITSDNVVGATKFSMALRPADLQNWVDKHGPYMYHWTRPEHVDSILQNGLIPSDRRVDEPEEEEYNFDPWEPTTEHAQNWGGFEATRPNHVYMTTPAGSADMRGRRDGNGNVVYDQPIAIDVSKLDPNKFKADEDWAYRNWPALRPPDVDQDDWHQDGPPSSRDWPDAGTLGDWADTEPMLDDPDWAQRSLEDTEQPALAYEGTIPPHAIHHPWRDEGENSRRKRWMDAVQDGSADPTHEGYMRFSAAPDDVGQKIRKLLEADPSAAEVYDALSPLGNVYVVGGAIRDLALGRIPKDIDIMAQGIEPEDAIKALKLRPGHVEVTGNQFPVIRYFHPSGYQCEVALPRREQSTGGGRKQDFEVQMDVNMPVEEDLERRDFTGNSMAVDLKTGQLIDPYGGWKHLEDGELKMVHPNAFVDDATRILRALSSRSRHGLKPDAETMQAMEQWASRINTHVPNEQKAAELEKLLSGDDPASAIELAQKTGVLKHILPELDETVGFDQKSKYHGHLLFDHIMEVLRSVSEINKDPDVRMAALLHDIGKPGSQWFDDAGYGHYYRKHFREDELDENGQRKQPIGLDHEHHGADLARDRLRDLTWGNKDRQKRVEHLVRHHMFAPFSDEKGARKFLNKVEGPDHAKDLIDIRQGDAGSKAMPWDGDEGKMRGLIDSVQQQGQATDLSGLALNGQDVMQILGIKPSREVGEHLKRLQEIVLEDPTMNNRQILTEALTMKQATRRVLAKEFDGWCWALLPEKAPLPEAPDADNSHITLAMVKGMDGMDRAMAASIAKSVIVPITAKITGCTAFPEGDDGQPIVLVISAPEIDDARDNVTELLDEVDADYSSDYGFIPHITLGYARDDDEVTKLTEEGDALIGEEIVFDRTVYSGGDGVWKTPGGDRAKVGNILDPVQETLDPDVFDNADKAKPKVKPHIVEWIRKQVDTLLSANGWEHVVSHTKLVMTGSLTSYQWSHKSDFDVSVWFDYTSFPNIVRAAMISLMVEELDGTIVPGTTHELQCYIVPDDVTPEELYQPGLRSAFDLDKNKWMVAPERDRVFNPYTEVPALMGWVHDQAEKLKLLKNYDEPLYKEFLSQIHHRRQRDQKAGKGDFSESNIVWKYIEHMGLT